MLCRNDLLNAARNLISPLAPHTSLTTQFMNSSVGVAFLGKDFLAKTKKLKKARNITKSGEKSQ